MLLLTDYNKHDLAILSAEKIQFIKLFALLITSTDKKGFNFILEMTSYSKNKESNFKIIVMCFST